MCQNVEHRSRRAANVTLVLISVPKVKSGAALADGYSLSRRIRAPVRPPPRHAHVRGGSGL